MATQTQRGKAFEYACLIAVEESLRTYQGVRIINSNALTIARGFYEEFQFTDPVLISKLDRAARAASRIIFRLEPQLQNPGGNEPLYLSIQADSQGIAGDVRDILCVRQQNGWWFFRIWERPQVGYVSVTFVWLGAYGRAFYE